MNKTPLINLPNREKIRINYGLSWLTGNRAPYFSITATIYEKRANGRLVDIGGGCCHDSILKARPDMADIVALLLCDIDGAPMYALENGFYHLGGTKYSRPNYIHAANHFRITEGEARQLVRDLFGDSFSETAGFLSQDAAKDAKARLAVWVDSQRARWNQDAQTVIAKYGLAIPQNPNQVAA
jgi:hypothetical protein